MVGYKCFTFSPRSTFIIVVCGCFTFKLGKTFSFKYLLEWLTGDLLFYYTIVTETIQDNIFLLYCYSTYGNKPSKSLSLSLYETFIANVGVQTANDCLKTLQLAKYHHPTVVLSLHEKF